MAFLWTFLFSETNFCHRPRAPLDAFGNFLSMETHFPDCFIFPENARNGPRRGKMGCNKKKKPRRVSHFKSESVVETYAHTVLVRVVFAVVVGVIQVEIQARHDVVEDADFPFLAGTGKFQ